MSEDLTAWLRTQVEARLALAREACHGTDGHWWRGSSVMFMDGTREPTGPLYGGEPVIGYDDEVFGGEHIVVYDEGAPSGWQFDHIAANDPRDVIARCEAELAILDLYEQTAVLVTAPPAVTAAQWPGAGPQPGMISALDYQDARRELAVLGPVIRMLAYGYRHRDGYREEWAP